MSLHDGLLPTLEKLKDMGYDGVELPMFNLTVEKYAAWGKHLDDLGLERTAVTVRGEEDNPISPDAARRAAGVANNKRALDCCQAAGCHAPGGPLSLGTRLLHRPGPHGRRVEVGRRVDVRSRRSTPSRPA